MKTAAVIAEFNPFHNGHAHLIERTRREAGADMVIALMSPDYVQRGLPAFADKYTRTQMALYGGADVVLEMPVRTALSSAGDFALGSVKILDALSVVDILSFGAETDEPELLMSAAKVLYSEPEIFKSTLKDELKAGVSYAAAREKALGACPELSFLSKENLNLLVGSSNNILAIEYLRSLLETGSSMTPFIIRREGDAYHSIVGDNTGSLASAEGIRRSFAEDPGRDLSPFIPDASLKVLQEDLARFGTWDRERYSLLLHYVLINNDPEKYMDVTPALASRIRSLISDYCDALTFSDLLKTKQVSLTHIRRALLHCCLGLEKEGPEPGSYVRILGFRKGSEPLLKKMKDNSAIPIVTKPADAGKKLDAEAFASFEENRRSSELYRLLQPRQKRENELTRSPIIINV